MCATHCRIFGASPLFQNRRVSTRSVLTMSACLWGIAAGSCRAAGSRHRERSKRNKPSYGKLGAFQTTDLVYITMLDQND
jgi:hypothetical protein